MEKEPIDTSLFHGEISNLPIHENKNIPFLGSSMKLNQKIQSHFCDVRILCSNVE